MDLFYKYNSPYLCTVINLIENKQMISGHREPKRRYDKIEFHIFQIVHYNLTSRTSYSMRFRAENGDG